MNDTLLWAIAVVAIVGQSLALLLHLAWHSMRGDFRRGRAIRRGRQ